MSDRILCACGNPTVLHHMKCPLCEEGAGYTPNLPRKDSRAILDELELAREALTTIKDGTDNHWVWYHAQRGLGEKKSPSETPAHAKLSIANNQDMAVNQAANGGPLTDEVLSEIESWLAVANDDPGYITSYCMSGEWHAALNLVHEYVQNEKKLQRSFNARYVRALLHEVKRLRAL